MVQYKGQIDRRKWLYLAYGDHSGGYTREITQNGQNLSSQTSIIGQKFRFAGISDFQLLTLFSQALIRGPGPL